jgi:hypothetical protein
MTAGSVSLTGGSKKTTPPLKPKNTLSFLKDGTACVVFFPFTAELTQSEKTKIDAASRKRFFVYTCSDTPIPPGHPRIGIFEKLYPIDSIRWAVGRSTYMSSLVTKASNVMSAPGYLLSSLMDLDAKSGNDDHNSALFFVTDRAFVGDDVALCRTKSTQAVVR